MFIGHNAVAFAAKKIAPKTSLGTLFLSVQFLDLLWPVLLLLGFEHFRIDPGNTVVTPFDFYDYPISHSLLGAAVWSAALGLLYAAFRADTAGSVVIGLCVFSHWILDFISHRPDLPLGFGGGTVLGLKLWNSLPGTLAVELSLFVAGIAVYLTTTRPKNRAGSLGFWILAVTLAAIYFANLFGPLPSNEQAVAIAANASWLFVLWAYWVDRGRTAVDPFVPALQNQGGH